ncbi:hypothetical protein [Streptomyces malaysiensis]|uniref:Uncharacterized protein n=1 Tax=Streptomyces malaysiensis TaxID=92644 RepID=A0A2J7YNN6_STRMQ|nr:hypothetical protein [Streptomyces malaysiensis]PNG89650.1 hypothetical protein SMF913_25115 [Streptomyces malaysiensis]
MADSVRDAVLGSVLVQPQRSRAGDLAGKAAVHAIALKALLGDGVRHLTPGERALLGELLDRIADDGTAAETAD